MIDKAIEANQGKRLLTRCAYGCAESERARVESHMFMSRQSRAYASPGISALLPHS